MSFLKEKDSYIYAYCMGDYSLLYLSARNLAHIVLLVAYLMVLELPFADGVSRFFWHPLDVNFLLPVHSRISKYSSSHVIFKI
jgi:hypothetical protein